MTHTQAIQLLSECPAKVLIVGIKKEGEEYFLDNKVCFTREDVLGMIKDSEEFRLFYFKENKEDAVYLKNESKKL